MKGLNVKNVVVNGRLRLMNKLKYTLLEVKNIFDNIPIVSKIFMLIYLIIVFSIYFQNILKGVSGVIIFLLSTFMYMLILLLITKEG